MRVARWMSALLLAAASAAAAGAELDNLASVSGAVTAPVPFKAAKVYFRNAERRMQYMVYTASGVYRARYLLPGEYEMRVEARGLESIAKKVSLEAGGNPPVGAELRASQTEGEVVTLREMFPPGPGQEYVMTTCIGCHNPNLFADRRYPEAAWGVWVDAMVKGGQVPRGFTSEQERADLIAYLGRNFGPDSKKRVVRFEKEVPLDEAKLADAMYVEYYL